jgi:lipopolysaccharide/colanic/teichoic acid biosynthesis glycosyltransferase
MYKNFFKRLLDFIMSFLGILILSPIIVLITLLLFFANKGKPFFFQIRPGKGERIFKIIKFKTMNDKRDENGDLLPDKYRLTKIGRIIRKTSIDEIPQLMNVCIGDMSLIGPRPLLLNYLPYYYENERLRHSVRPGITGLAQVNGRNTVGWDERLAFDIEYVKNISFNNDLKILYQTVKKIINSESIVIDPESIMQNLDNERKLQY